MTQTLRRLPGVHFERQAPPLQEVLPRMDIAGFVGFAASGPLDVPVPVEDPTQFARVFGADAPIAWDRRRGESARGLLGPAVRAFFRNGGRRCWVVRVAHNAPPGEDPQMEHASCAEHIQVDDWSKQSLKIRQFQNSGSSNIVCPTAWTYFLSRITESQGWP